MIFVTCSSPLYSFNFWNDANVYLTLGRGILHGVVPYRDLYEQKGPLFYLIHAIAALISQDSFIGVWIIEICMALLFSFFTWKTVKLCTTPQRHAVLLMPMLISAVYTVGMLNFGDSTEEFCFPLLTIIFYIVLRDSTVTEDRLPSSKSALIIGMLTAVLLWIKYTFLGPVIGLCILMVVWTIKPRAWKRLAIDIGMFLAGLAVTSLPVILYLVVNNALYDMFTAYFYNNIFFYLDKVVYDLPILSAPIIGKLIMPFVNLLGICLLFPKYPVFLLLCIAGLFCCNKDLRSRAVQVFVVTFYISILATMSRQQILPYYGYITMYVAPYAGIACSFLFSFLDKRLTVRDGLIPMLLTLLSVAILSFNIVTNKNMFMLRYQKSDYPQYKFAEAIKETPDANILTYDLMDYGFYLASGTLPKTKYYCYLTIEESWPVILEEQTRMIKNKEFDYIIAHSNEYDWEGYEVIDSADIIYTGITGDKYRGIFYLYKKTI